MVSYMTDEGPGELWASRRRSNIRPFYRQGPMKPLKCMKHKPNFEPPPSLTCNSVWATSFPLLSSFVRSLNSFFSFFSSLPSSSRSFSNRLREVYCSGMKYVISLSQSPKIRCTLFRKVGQYTNAHYPGAYSVLTAFCSNMIFYDSQKVGIL